LFVQALVTFRYRILRDRDDGLEPSAVPADVTSEFPHETNHDFIARFIAKEDSDYLRQASGEQQGWPRCRWPAYMRGRGGI
jgi:hypothetical protein